jgi:hypothetical protein
MSPSGRRLGRMLVVLALIVATILSGYALATMGWSGVPTALVAVAGVALVLGIRRCYLVPSIAALEAGIEIVNPFRRLVVPWPDVVDVTPGPAGLVIRRHHGRPVVAWAVQKNNLAMWIRRREPADEVADELKRITASHDRGPTSGLDLGVPA